jgi:DNA primase
VLVPHLRNRPFTIKRHYTVPRGPFVWEKDAPSELPEWIPLSPQPAKSRRGAIVRYPLVNDDLALRASSLRPSCAPPAASSPTSAIPTGGAASSST